MLDFIVIGSIVMFGGGYIGWLVYRFGTGRQGYRLFYLLAGFLGAFWLPVVVVIIRGPFVTYSFFEAGIYVVVGAFSASIIYGRIKLGHFPFIRVPRRHREQMSTTDIETKPPHPSSAQHQLSAVEVGAKPSVSISDAPLTKKRQKTLFISYRRADSQDIAGRIYDRLVGSFGRDAIFKDVDAIGPGLDFRSVITDHVNQCDIMLVLIGKAWLNVQDEDGVRRLDQANDFVRYEIEIGLQRDIMVVPVLLNNALLPSLEELPDSLQSLAYRNAVVVRPDPDFHRDMDRLISAIQQFPTTR